MYARNTGVEILHACTESVLTDFNNFAIEFVVFYGMFAVTVIVYILVGEFDWRVFRTVGISVLIRWEQLEKIYIINLIMFVLSPVLKPLHNVIFGSLASIRSQVRSEIGLHYFEVLNLRRLRNLEFIVCQW